MDWKYCSNQFTLCIPPILIVNHFAVDTIFKSFIYLLCTKLLPILYGWSLYKMHKGVIFENLLKDLLINFVNKLKKWISREFCFLFQAYICLDEILTNWRKRGCLLECKIYASILTFSIVKRTQPNKYLHIRREKNPSASFWERLGM